MEKMNRSNIDFLCDINKNAAAAINSISGILPKVDNDDLKKDIETELHELRSVEMESRKALSGYGEPAAGVSSADKLGSWAAINLGTLTDRTPSRIAEIMMQGNSAGIIDLTRSINENSLADAQYKTMAVKLLEIKKRSLDSMKRFL